jgi:hypothetical protein
MKMLWIRIQRRRGIGDEGVEGVAEDGDDTGEESSSRCSKEAVGCMGPSLKILAMTAKEFLATVKECCA